MNLDMTFCTAKKCKIKNECGRYQGHLKDIVDKIYKPISIAEFSDEKGVSKIDDCELFFHYKKTLKDRHE